MFLLNNLLKLCNLAKLAPKSKYKYHFPKKKKKKKVQINKRTHSTLHGVKSESETKTMGSMWMMRQVSIRVAASTNSLLLSNPIITSQFPISFSFSSSFYPKSQYLISLVSSSHRHSLSTTAASSSSSSSHFGLSFFTIPLIFIMSETLVLVFLISNCFFFFLFFLGDVEEIEVSKNGSNSKTLLKGLTYSEFEVMFHLSLILIILGSV